MAETTRTYNGPLPAGRVQLPGRRPMFERDVPLEVTDEEAAALEGDADWSAPRRRRAAAEIADPPTDTPIDQGDPPETKEP